jgi:hypothetical protein
VISRDHRESLYDAVAVGYTADELNDLLERC